MKDDVQRAYAALGLPFGASARLSREEIDGIVRAIGTESPLDSVLGWLEGLVWPTSPRDLSSIAPRAIALGVMAAAILIAIRSKHGGVIFYMLYFVVIVAALLSRLEKGRGR